jgi:hypothetical protein
VCFLSGERDPDIRGFQSVESYLIIDFFDRCEDSNETELGNLAAILDDENSDEKEFCSRASFNFLRHHVRVDG